MVLTEPKEKVDAEFLDWARRISVDQIPEVLAFLTARLLVESGAKRKSDDSAGSRDEKKLLTAGELAARLNLPESWVRNEERLGRIPSVRAGRYVRFRLNAVEQALAETRSQRA